MEFNDIDEAQKKTFIENIKQGTLFRLKGDKPFQSEDYHVFVVLNANWQTGEILYLENGTSKVEKRRQILREIGFNPEEVTVEIPAGRYSFFTKDTLIDCHDVSAITIDEMNFGNNNFIYLEDSLSDEDLSRILRAVNSSPQISPVIKRKLGC